MQGPLNAHGKKLQDAKGLQKFPYALLIVILLVIGFLPSTLLPTISTGTKPILDRLQNVPVKNSIHQEVHNDV